MNESEGSNSGLPDPPGDVEALRFRAWPCTSCRKDLTPIHYLIRRQEADHSFRSATVEAKIEKEIQWLKEWVGLCSHNHKEFPATELTEGSEHRVYLEQQSGGVVKCTLTGLYGDRYALKEGTVWQYACTPYEYLVRLHLWRRLFGFAPRPVGIFETGQIVSEQEFVSGNMPTQEMVNEFMRQSGLVAVKESAWLWKIDDETQSVSTWVGDARSDNFVEHEGQIIPIDLRLWLTRRERRS